MRRYVATALLAALVLMAACPARAERVRYLPVNEDLKVRLKFGEVTRVIFPDRVEKALPNSNILSIKMEGRSLYLSPMTPGAAKTLWVTAGGLTHALKVSEGDPADETVILVSLRDKPSSSAASGFSAGARTLSPAACLLKAMAGGNQCPGAARRARRATIYEDAFLKVLSLETLSLGPLTGLRALVLNKTSTPLRIDPRRFEFPGAVAVAVDNSWLPPGGEGSRSTLYVVVDRRLR